MAPTTMVSKLRIGFTPFPVPCSCVAGSFFIAFSVKYTSWHEMTNVVWLFLLDIALMGRSQGCCQCSTERRSVPSLDADGCRHAKQSIMRSNAQDGRDAVRADVQPE